MYKQKQIKLKLGFSSQETDRVYSTALEASMNNQLTLLNYMPLVLV